MALPPEATRVDTFAALDPPGDVTAAECVQKLCGFLDVLYLDWLLVKSVERPFLAFARGFVTLVDGPGLKPADWDKYAVSMTITLGMAAGAVLGAAALHANPIGADTNDFTLAPVAVTLFFALRAHDSCVPPPGGWPEHSSSVDAAANGGGNLAMLKEPLRGAAAA